MSRIKHIFVVLRARTSVDMGQMSGMYLMVSVWPSDALIHATQSTPMLSLRLSSPPRHEQHPSTLRILSTSAKLSCTMT